MNFMWITDEIHLNFISILYELHMNLSWNSREMCTGRQLWIWCKQHMNFTSTSYKSYESFICTSHVAHMKYNWSLHDSEVIVIYFIQISIVFHMTCIWSTYETIIWVVWSSCEVCIKFTCVFLNKFLVKFTTSSYKVHIKLIWNSYEFHTNEVHMWYIWNVYESIM